MLDNERTGEVKPTLERDPIMPSSVDRQLSGDYCRFHQISAVHQSALGESDQPRAPSANYLRIGALTAEDVVDTIFQIPLETYRHGQSPICD